MSRLQAMRVRLFALVLALLLPSLFASSPASAGEVKEIVYEPPGAWVERHEPDRGATSKEGEVVDGSWLLLHDVQLHAATDELYVHRARRLVSPAGVESFSEIEIGFDPHYQRLRIHALRLLRGDDSIDVLHRADVKVMDRETDLAAKMLYGKRTALIVLHDVRVGDIVDIEYSIIGQNPVLGGKFLRGVDLAMNAPVHRLFRRVVHPESRPVAFRVIGASAQPSSTTSDGDRVLVWDLRDVSAVMEEDFLPTGYDPGAWVQLTEYASWKEVVEWALPMYRASAPPGEALEKRIEEIRAAHQTPEARTLAALALVQSEIRYLGIELGASSHEPARAAVTYERRYGDCKDKTILLVTALRALGVEADPALVNTGYRGEIAGLLPSSLAFDHVITRVRIGERTYWLDATQAKQDEPLEKRDAPRYGKALVVREDTSSLSDIAPTPLTSPLISVLEEYTIDDFAAPASLVVTTVFRGRRAEQLRARLASEPKADVARSFLNFYASDDLDIVQEAEPDFRDEPSAGTVTVIERYRLPTFFHGETRSFRPWALGEYLVRPKIVRRTMPLSVPFPVKVEHTSRITFPTAYVVDRDTRDLSDATFRFHLDATSAGRVLTVHHSMEILRDTVPAAEVSDYLKMLDRIGESYGYVVDQRAKKLAARAEEPAPKFFWILLGGVGAWLGFVVVRGAASSIRARSAVRRGDTPATALPVESTSEVEAHLAKATCECGRRASFEPARRIWSSAELAGRRIVAVRASCPSCGEWTRRWFDPRGVELPPSDR